MKLCNNCGAQLSCGCQRRTASDNVSCCEACIHEYEAKLNPPKPAPLPTKPIEKKVESKTTQFELTKIDDKS